MSRAIVYGLVNSWFSKATGGAPNERSDSGKMGVGWVVKFLYFEKILEMAKDGKLELGGKCTQMGSDLATDWPFTDPEWIEPSAKIRAFRPHKDRR